MSTAQQKLDIAQRFTFTERTALRVWFDLDSAGLDVDADRFLQAGLILEHFQSRLDDDPAKRSIEDTSMEQQLQQQFQNELDLAQGLLKAKANAKAKLPIVTEIGSFPQMGGGA